MDKILNAATIPVHAGKPLNRKARGSFNDYPIWHNCLQEYGVERRG